MIVLDKCQTKSFEEMNILIKANKVMFLIKCLNKLSKLLAEDKLKL